MNNKSIGNIFKGDKVIWMVFFFLCKTEKCSFHPVGKQNNNNSRNGIKIDKRC